MTLDRFDSLTLPQLLADNIAAMGFTTPTPIQAQAIPVALEGRDILGSAQTGTGKTAAFAIPVIARLMNDPTAAALVMTPTRELATQIQAVAHQMLKGGTINTALLIGGDSMDKQFRQLRVSPRLVIGTPGRINDHLRRDRGLLSDVNMVVLDEADRMLDMGFSTQIDEVLALVAPERQMLMFSATFAPAIVRFSKTYLDNPQRIAIAPESRTADRVQQDVVNTTEGEKYDTLVRELDARTGSIIVFVRTKHGADRLARKLEKEKHDVDAIHGDLRQNKRDRVIASFRAGKVRILVATDVAARGIDVPHVEHVINYDLPQVAEDYIHRIGRTARAGAEGHALSLLCPSDNEKWAAIGRILDPNAAPERAAAPARKGSKGGKPSYKKAGGFNDRKAGEGFSHKKKRTDRSEGFRKDRDEGKKRPRFDREDQPQRRDRPQREDRAYRGDRPQRAEQGARRPRFDRDDRPQREDRPYRTDRPQRADRDDRHQRRDDRPHRGNARFADERGGRRRDEGAGRFDRFDSNDRRSDRDFRGGDFRDDGYRNAGDRPYKGKPSGDRKPFGKKPYEKKSGESKGGESRGGERKSFGKKPFGGKPGGKPFGDRNKQGGSRRGAGRHQQSGKHHAA